MSVLNELHAGAFERAPVLPDHVAFHNQPGGDIQAGVFRQSGRIVEGRGLRGHTTLCREGPSGNRVLGAMLARIMPLQMTEKLCNLLEKHGGGFLLPQAAEGETVRLGRYLGSEACGDIDVFKMLPDLLGGENPEKRGTVELRGASGPRCPVIAAATSASGVILSNAWASAADVCGPTQSVSGGLNAGGSTPIHATLVPVR